MMANGGRIIPSHNISIFKCIPMILSVIFPHVTSNDCPQSIFVVEQSGFVAGKVIDAHPNARLDDCVTECARRKSCSGANFIIDIHARPTCLLMDLKRKARDSETPNGGNVMYAAQRICTKFKVDQKLCVNQSPWQFERFPKYALANETFVLEALNGVEIDECMYKCSLREDCAAAVFSRKDNICSLSRVSLNNVNSIRQYFRYDANTDVYEANCVNRTYNGDYCNFLRINHAGFTDLYDARIKAANRMACETKCLDSLRFTTASRKISSSVCRSYTYDAREQLCYLSHGSQRAFGRNALDHSHEDLSYGDLDNCIQFNLDCMARALVLRGKSLKLFHGTIRAKQDGELTCPRQIFESYDFSAEYPFHECHLHRETHPTTTYSSLLVVKEGTTELITVHDKMIQVSCRLQHQRPHSHKSPHFDIVPSLASLQNQTNGVITATIAGVSVAPVINVVPTSPLMVAGGKQLVEDLMRQSARAARPKYTLEVLDRLGRPATIVDINERGYLQITMNDNADRAHSADRFFIVSDLVAESVSENKSVYLIDSNGCVSNTDLVTSMRRVGRNKLQIEVRFGGFHDQSKVTYQTLVKRCSYGCFAECNRKYFAQDLHFEEYYSRSNETRARRALSMNEEAATADHHAKRHYSFSEDLHVISVQTRQLRHVNDSAAVLNETSDAFSRFGAVNMFGLAIILLAVLIFIAVTLAKKAYEYWPKSRRSYASITSSARPDAQSRNRVADGGISQQERVSE